MCFVLVVKTQTEGDLPPRTLTLTSKGLRPEEAPLQTKGSCKEEKTITALVNVRTPSSNCVITNSCLLMQRCLMARQTG